MGQTLESSQRGSGAECPSSRETGRGRKGGRPLARHATHVRGEPGAKPFVDDLLLGRGFVRSRAAPSLRSIESQPSTQGFVSSTPRGGKGGPGRPAPLPLPPPALSVSLPSIDRLFLPSPGPSNPAGVARRPAAAPGARCATRPGGAFRRWALWGRRSQKGGAGPPRRVTPRRRRGRACPPPRPRRGPGPGLGRGWGGGGGPRAARAASPRDDPGGLPVPSGVGSRRESWGTLGPQPGGAPVGGDGRVSFPPGARPRALLASFRGPGRPAVGARGPRSSGLARAGAQCRGCPNGCASPGRDTVAGTCPVQRSTSCPLKWRGEARTSRVRSAPRPGRVRDLRRGSTRDR